MPFLADFMWNQFSRIAPEAKRFYFARHPSTLHDPCTSAGKGHSHGESFDPVRAASEFP
jgi:hypothetical protein